MYLHPSSSNDQVTCGLQGNVSKKEGVAAARSDVPFLFKAFETGQAPPPRPGTKKAEETRAATIHEYLDWTLTREEGLVDDLVTEKAVGSAGFVKQKGHPERVESKPKSPGKASKRQDLNHIISRWSFLGLLIWC
jgi:hypothetical protein